VPCGRFRKAPSPAPACPPSALRRGRRPEPCRRWSPPVPRLAVRA
jgi:hypothetical protein